MANLTQYTGGVAQSGGVTISQEIISQADYDALATKDPHTLYFITE